MIPPVAARFGIPLLLALLIAAVFGQTAGHDFLPIDDPQYVSGNPVVSRGLSLDGVGRAFSGPLVLNYHPLTIVSHMADVSLFGLSPAGHHAMSVVLHLFASVALYFLIVSLTGFPWVGGIVGALFAVHPLHVEPVAWIASRKDLLCALFWFLSLSSWVGYAREGGCRRYASSLLFAALSMLSKPMAVTLPLTLLMLDQWPLARIGRIVSWRKAFVEKIPFLMLSAAMSVVTVVAQEEGGAIQATDFSLSARLSSAAVSYATYLIKTVWPSRLAVFNPHPSLLPETALPPWMVVLSVASLAGITAVAWRERSRRPHLLFGWSFFVVTLVPVIGVVQVGGQAIADRYTYVPLVGIFVALAVEGNDRLAGRGKTWRRGGMAAAVVVVLALSVVSFRQVTFWREGVVLFRHAIAVTGPNPTMNRFFGEYLIRLKRFDDAKVAFRETVRYWPNDPVALDGLGCSMAFTGENKEAEEVFRRVLSVAPGYPPTWHNLGSLFLRQGRLPEAVEVLGNAVRVQPDDSNVWLSLGTAKGMSGDYPGALGALSQAVALDSGSEEAWYKLGLARLETGDTAGADAAENRLRELGSRLADRLRLVISLRRETSG